MNAFSVLHVSYTYNCCCFECLWLSQRIISVIFFFVRSANLLIHQKYQCTIWYFNFISISVWRRAWATYVNQLGRRSCGDLGPKLIINNSQSMCLWYRIEYFLPSDIEHKLTTNVFVIIRYILHNNKIIQQHDVYSIQVHWPFGFLQRVYFGVIAFHIKTNYTVFYISAQLICPCYDSFFQFLLVNPLK